MKPHTRIRKTIKWGGAAVTVLLLTAWIISCFASWDDEFFRGIIKLQTDPT